MKKIAIIYTGIVLFLLFVYVLNMKVHAQQLTTVVNETLTLPDDEKYMLQSMGKDLIITQKDFAAAQTEMNRLNQVFSTQSVDLDTKVAMIKLKHKWGDDVIFNRASGNFERVPKPPVAEPAKDKK